MALHAFWVPHINTHVCSGSSASSAGASAATAAAATSEASDGTLPAETIAEAANQMQGSEEGRMIGHVRWQVYTAYMKAVGTGLVLFVLLSLALMQVSIVVGHSLLG